MKKKKEICDRELEKENHSICLFVIWDFCTIQLNPVDRNIFILKRRNTNIEFLNVENVPFTWLPIQQKQIDWFVIWFPFSISINWFGKFLFLPIQYSIFYSAFEIKWIQFQYRIHFSNKVNVEFGFFSPFCTLFGHLFGYWFNLL